MRRQLALTAALAFALGACGSELNDTESNVPDETRAPTPAVEPEPTGPEPTEPAPTQPESTEPASSETPSTRPASTETVAATSLPESGEPTDTAGDTTAPADSEAPPPDASPSSSDRLSLLAVTDLADRLGLEVDDIEVVEVEEVTWRDGSLGCPQKDFSYIQVLTPGVRIVLSAQDSTYAYHAGADRDPFYCIDPQPPV